MPSLQQEFLICNIIPEILGEAKELVMINASGNEVNGTLDKFLISPPHTLERLLLWNTQLHHTDIRAIVESIGGEGGSLKLPRLRVSEKLETLVP